MGRKVPWPSGGGKAIHLQKRSDGNPRVRVGPLKRFQTRRRPRNDGSAARCGPARASNACPPARPMWHMVGLQHVQDLTLSIAKIFGTGPASGPSRPLPDPRSLFRGRNNASKSPRKGLAAGPARQTRREVPHCPPLLYQDTLFTSHGAPWPQSRCNVGGPGPVCRAETCVRSG